ncbi:bifunctional oligoribonuclease/PAP phosphatase NrnA [Dorea sp. OM02-2LB]|nr:bifunctional oligoribonuclease/PAP phosphatase NrnA [Dorea sp. OM02-2LB]RGV93349.1 bifunctional oligoribonuclease/PAP phosphatase NrnA [Ruminococcus sp. AF14-10]
MKKLLQEILKEKKTVGIAGHVRPDGDCVGSCVGLYLYLTREYPEIKTDVYLEEVPAQFLVLKGTDQVKNQAVDQVYDLFISLDCGSPDRLGFAEEMFRNAKTTLCVDHHISNLGYARENYVVPDASSTSELICRMIGSEGLDREIAEALYVGIAHDTGVFLYSCTSPETMEVAADLLRTGLDANALIDHTYYSKTYIQQQILGRALLESMFLLDKKCIVSVITKKVMDFYGAKASDLEGIVSQLRNTTGVEVAIFLHELDSGEFKVSLRSNGLVDVSSVAQYFGGGGHVRAAGVTMQGSVHDVINNLLRKIAPQITEEDGEKA